MVASGGAVADQRLLPHRQLTLLGCLLCGAACLGCQPEAGRAAVSGQVTWPDGQRLEYGMIEFASLNSAAPATAGAAIIDGAYHIPREKGLPRGKYCVRIYASIVLPFATAGAPGALGVAPPRERVAAECNVASRLTAEVESEDDQQFDFRVVRSTLND